MSSPLHEWELHSLLEEARDVCSRPSHTETIFTIPAPALLRLLLEAVAYEKEVARLNNLVGVVQGLCVPGVNVVDIGRVIELGHPSFVAGPPP